MNAADALLTARLQDLAGELDEATVDLLVMRFVETAGNDVARIRSHAAERDFAGLRDAAHALKGAAAYLGARGVYDLCVQLERQAESGDVRRQGLVETLAAEVARVLATLTGSWRALRDRA